MGRLEIQVRHGGGHPAGPGGAVVALAVVVVLAAAGGAGRHALDNIAHEVLAVVEIIGCAVGGLAVVALAVVIARAVARARAAASARLDAPRPPVVWIDDAGHIHPVPAEAGRPALAAPRCAASWPLSGRWSEVSPDDPGTSDPARYS